MEKSVQVIKHKDESKGPMGGKWVLQRQQPKYTYVVPEVGVYKELLGERQDSSTGQAKNKAARDLLK